MTLQEWKAQLGMGRGAGAPVQAAAPDPTTELDANYQPDPNNEHLSLTEDPARYLGHAAKGLLHSPIDAVESVAHTVAHPIDSFLGLAKGIAGAIKHPVDTLQYANTHPDALGSLLGQGLLAEAAPPAINATLREGPSMVGRGMTAVGKGAEAAGDFSARTMRKGVVPVITAATNHPWLAAAELAAPPVLRAGGKALQRGGAALEGLDLSFKGRGASAVAETPSASDADVVRETVNTARGLKDGGMSAGQASQRAGWPLGKSTEVPYQAETATPNPDLFPYQSEELANGRSARRIDALGKKIGENSWAGDASAQPASIQGLQAAVGNEPKPSPIEQFYRDDPQARVGGEGRMTGQFDEGSGGLTDAAAGNLDTYVSPKTLAQLSEMSGRALSPADAQAILNQYRSIRVQE